jgi:hypothetical protein
LNSSVPSFLRRVREDQRVLKHSLGITVVDVWRKGLIASGNGKSEPWLDEFYAKLTNATHALMSKSLGKAVSKPTSAIPGLSMG